MKASLTLGEPRRLAPGTDNEFRERLSRSRRQIPLGQRIGRAGLHIAAWQQQSIVLRYTELRQLTRELKAIGASNVNRDRPSGLTGRQRLSRFASAYEAMRGDDGLLPATYEVWFLALQRPLELFDE